MKIYIIIISITILAVSMSVSAYEEKTGESCESCHSREMPNMIKIWKSSAHVENDLECVDCHGDNYEDNHRKDGQRRAVEASVCARCHSDAAKEHFAGKHGIGFRAGRACTRNLRATPEIKAGCNDCHEEGSALPRQNAECARFLAQTPEMQRQGCLSCHKIEVRCDSCHTSHDTDLQIVRSPAVCGTCHMGPDHPQYEMWDTSGHGVLYKLKGRDYAPDCATCHMPEGTHNISTGISMGLFGQKYDEGIRKTERENMLKVCSRCHARSVAARNLEDGDAIQKQARALIDEAALIIQELNDEGLLQPSPAERPEHPLAGHKLDIGPQMLYEDLSGVEAIYFRMKKFYYIITYKGVFHQNPDYAHWYGNAPLKLALSEIRSASIKLREIKLLQERVDNLSKMGFEEMKPGLSSGEQTLKNELRQLRERYLKGDLTEQELNEKRNDLLDKQGL
jgi:hypothetical protein